MKKAAILATVLAAALCAAPLAACDVEGAAPQAGSPGPVEVNGKAFNMADYAIELPDSKTVKDGAFIEGHEFTSIEKLNFQLSIIPWNGNNGFDVVKEVGTGTNEGKYRLYDVKAFKSTGDWYSSIDAVNYNSPFLALTSAGDSGTIYSYAYPTGELVTTKTFDSLDEVSTNSDTFVHNDRYTTYYSLTYSTGTDTETTVNVAYVDGAWKKLTEEEVQPQQESDGYEIGDVLGVTKEPLVDLNTYPDYIYKDYSYTEEGDGSVVTYTFYKNDEKLNSFMVFGSSGFYTVGKYCYFYEIQPVSSEATSGYNMEMVDDYSSTVTKVNMILHRYNFVESKDEVVDADYIYAFPGFGARPIYMGPIYNRTTNDFDRIVANAYPKIGGVAVVSEQYPCYTFILDDEAKISLDLSGKNVAATFYRLSDNRFLSGDVILDKEMNMVADLSAFNSTVVWEEQSLILCGTYVGSTMEYIAIDYDGKVAITGMRCNRGTYGGVCGDSLLADNKDGEDAVFSKSEPTGKTIDEIMGDKDYSEFASMLCVYEDGVYTFYNRTGKQIGTFEGSNAIKDLTFICGNAYFVPVTDADGNAVTLLIK